jgi:hypothetical protein
MTIFYCLTTLRNKEKRREEKRREEKTVVRDAIFGGGDKKLYLRF